MLRARGASIERGARWPSQAAMRAPERRPRGGLARAGPTRIRAGGDQSGVDVACPICLGRMWTFDGPASGVVESPPRDLRCGTCSKTFTSSGDYLDLTILPSAALEAPSAPLVQGLFDAVLGGSSAATGDATSPVYKEQLQPGSQVFRSPLISFVYERGWRQGFDWAGFPGKDKEFDMLLDLYARTEPRARPPPGQASSVLDVSCGSGLFTRKFYTSKRFSRIVSSDLSENMLRQAHEFLTSASSASDASTSSAGADADAGAGADPALILVRADVGRLPFASGTFDLVHAGAAVHCWPNPALAFAEIARVLKPGGRFIGSTFLLSASPLGQALGNDALVRPLFDLERQRGPMSQQGGIVRFWEEQELRDLADFAGLKAFTCERSNRFIMFCATKSIGERSDDGEEVGAAEEDLIM